MPIYDFRLSNGAVVEQYRKIADRDKPLIIDGVEVQAERIPTRIKPVIEGHVPNPQDPNNQAMTFMHEQEERDPFWHRRTGFSKETLKKTWTS